MVGPIDGHWNAYNAGELKETKTRSPLVFYHSTPQLMGQTHKAVYIFIYI
jgi:hypothetical protein